MKKILILISLITVMFVLAGCGENIAGQAVSTKTGKMTLDEWDYVKVVDGKVVMIGEGIKDCTTMDSSGNLDAYKDKPWGAIECAYVSNSGESKWRYCNEGETSNKKWVYFDSYGNKIGDYTGCVTVDAKGNEEAYKAWIPTGCAYLSGTGKKAGEYWDYCVEVESKDGPTPDTSGSDSSASGDSAAGGETEDPSEGPSKKEDTLCSPNTAMVAGLKVGSTAEQSDCAKRILQVSDEFLGNIPESECVDVHRGVPIIKTDGTLYAITWIGADKVPFRVQNWNMVCSNHIAKVKKFPSTLLEVKACIDNKNSGVENQNDGSLRFFDANCAACKVGELAGKKCVQDISGYTVHAPVYYASDCSVEPKKDSQGWIENAKTCFTGCTDDKGCCEFTYKSSKCVGNAMVNVTLNSCTGSLDEEKQKLDCSTYGPYWVKEGTKFACNDNIVADPITYPCLECGVEICEAVKDYFSTKKGSKVLLDSSDASCEKKYPEGTWKSTGKKVECS